MQASLHAADLSLLLVCYYCCHIEVSVCVGMCVCIGDVCWGKKLFYEYAHATVFVWQLALLFNVSVTPANSLINNSWSEDNHSCLLYLYCSTRRD